MLRFAEAVPNETYLFDDFTLDVTERRLVRGREAVALEPKTFDVLTALVRARFLGIEAEAGYRLMTLHGVTVFFYWLYFAQMALLLTLAHRTLTWSRRRDACLGTVRTTSMIFLVLITAKVMAVALAYYGVPMIVETSSAATITKRGNPWIFRISPPSEMEALGLERYLKDLGVKKADFLAVNTDWGRGAVGAFGDILKKSGAQVGLAEFMEQAATDMNAQITKVKAGDADTLFVTTAVEQITLVLRQAQEQRLTRKIVTTGGSSSPSQLIKQAGPAAEGTYHILFFLPWFPEAMPDGKLAKAFVDGWNKRGHPFDGLTEGFRGHDGVLTAAEAIKTAGKPDAKAVRDALWKVQLMGVNGPIKFEKDGPAGKESGQSKPSIFIVQIKDGKIALPAFAARK